MPEIDPNDTARYMEQAMVLVSTDPVLDRTNKALSLFSAGISMTPGIEWEAVYPNDFSALACLTRAYWQLRASYMLMISGYVEEVRVLSRAVYESAGLARMLAHDPNRADKWLHEGHWFPDREVRRWFAESVPNVTGSTPDEILDKYKAGYDAMSDRVHPTAIACASAIRLSDHGPIPKLETEFDEEEFRTCAIEIATATIFACFALRNAAVSEDALDPQWRQDVYELAREILGADMPHLERDWARGRLQFEQLQNRIQSAEHLMEDLRRDPRSWRNLRDSTASAERDGKLRRATVRSR